MRANLRFTRILLAGALWAAPAGAFAQATSQSPTNNSATPSTSIGPSELQNFSLSGTASKPDGQQAVTTPSTTSVSPRPKPVGPVHGTSLKTRSEPRLAKPVVEAKAAPVSSQLMRQPPASPPVLPQESRPAAPLAVRPAVGTGSGGTSAPAAPLEPGFKPTILPWLGAALALVGGVLFLIWRRRSKPALAGADFYDAQRSQHSTGPGPQPPRSPVPPIPSPAPAPARRPAAAKGIVATRLRPAIEIMMQPLRCLVDDEQIVIEFELELFNAGAAPARAILPEARLLNAGAGQDQELMSFFANPVGKGERVQAIGPMKRLSFTSKVTAPRAAIQEYELAGRKSFVPLIAFNALYSWSGGPAQTSAAYLVGRATKGNRLGPLRLDLGSHEFRNLDARILPSELRT